MVKLPGRISIRPLAKYVNRPQTHCVSLQDNKIEVDQKFAYQSLRSKVDYKDIADIRVGMDDLHGNPLTRNVTITTTHRQIYEIPEMDTTQATQLKEALETQKNMATQRREEIQKKSAADRSMSFSRYRR